ACKDRIPVRLAALQRRVPPGQVEGVIRELGHVVAGAAEQALERRFQRVRAGPEQARADDSQAWTFAHGDVLLCARNQPTPPTTSAPPSIARKTHALGEDQSTTWG